MEMVSQHTEPGVMARFGRCPDSYQGESNTSGAAYPCAFTDCERVVVSTYTDNEF